MQMLYVKIGEEIKGPYLTKQFGKMWDSGVITADAQFRFGDEGDWQSVLTLVDSLQGPSKSNSAEPEAPAIPNVQPTHVRSTTSRPKAKTLVLFGLLVALIVLFFSTTGPWTESGKANIDFKNSVISAKSNLESSYTNFSYIIPGALKTAEARGGGDEAVLGELTFYLQKESGFGADALANANSAFDEISKADQILTILRNNRDVSSENIIVYDAFKNCVVSNMKLLSALKDGTATTRHLHSWVETKTQYQEQRLDLKLSAEFRF